MRFLVIVGILIVFLYIIAEHDSSDCITDQCLVDRYCQHAEDVDVCVFGKPRF